MSKRARWLVVLGFLLPGSAQLLSGNRKLGRFGLTATIVLLVVGIASILGLMFARVATLTIFTNSWVLLILQWALFAYAVLWVLLGLNTLGLTRLRRVQPNWKMPVAILSVILTLVPAVGAAWAGTSVAAGRGALSDIFGSAPAVAPVDGRYNFLLLGTDAGADREGLRPDSISVISVDAETGQAAIIGVPRELEGTPFAEGSPMAEMHPNGFGVGPNEFGDYGGCQVGRCILNGIYAEAELFYPELYPNAKKHDSSPGIEATREAVEGALGLKIQFYVLLNMDGFADLIDALGGVTMDVKERLPIGGGVDPYSGEVVNEDGWIEPGKQHLNGFQAQWYARSRYGSSGGDYDRMQRQRELQAAILSQMNPTNVLLKFQGIAAAGTQLIETDIPESMLGRFVDLASKSREHDIVNVELVPPAVEPDAPDFDVIRQLTADGIAQASPPKKDSE
ncbi:LCP family protein [Leucobacter viscericola]|uniref:LCP family protein n=1 Tax=Leucobacter viscericola TaxID=2714935 RepID=A0A6G7XEL4_9MICO|nr:LCP family protein [Leucobacter viscericola]QIK63034.1 LCP family protein [Leucobacter viscericola]